MPLFDRAGRRLSLAEAGARLLAAGERVESIIIRDIVSLGESRQEIGGRVRIGTSEGFGAQAPAHNGCGVSGLEIELVAPTQLLPRHA